MQIEEKVISIIQANTEQKEPITPATDLRKELHLDSFGTVMIINALEQAFGVELEESDFAQIKTVGDVIKLLENRHVCA